MTAILTSESGDIEKVAEIVHECEKMNIEVLPPNINESFGGFTVIRGSDNQTGNQSVLVFIQLKILEQILRMQ